MSKNNLYDVIIIGAGPSGIFCAYELIRQKPELKILMVEKGRPIEKRVCPKRTTKVCVGCKPCSITTGFCRRRSIFRRKAFTVSRCRRKPARKSWGMTRRLRF